MMKKMMMMTAIVAMAFGAQADIAMQVYSYGLTLTNIKLADVDKLSSVKCYLIDTTKNGATGGDAGAVYHSTGKTSSWDGKAVMADFTLDMKQTYVESGSTVYFRYDYSAYQYNDGKVLARTSRTTADTTVSGSGDTRTAKTVTFRTADTDINWYDMGDGTTDPTVYDYVNDNLKAVIVATTKDAKTLEIVVDVTCNNDLKSLGSNATYTEIVPEPTSGMLVFLGLAGLMLKRKRAA